jgi:uncharacterized protein YyaL (SSP411 family)
MRWRSAGLGALAGWLVLSGTTSAQTVPADAAAGLLKAAGATVAATRAQLRLLSDASSCVEARYVAFRNSKAEPNSVDAWYTASQTWADAALLGATKSDDGETRCEIAKSVIFLDRLWDDDLGINPTASPTASKISRDVRYTDDNALLGLTYLAAASVSEPNAAAEYRHSAVRVAEFLLRSGVWDDTFGGGFWWSTRRGDTPEGKPAQTNAISALFFARLYAALGDSQYRDWAVRTQNWLDATLYDPGSHLYRWSIAYSDPLRKRGSPVLSNRLFSYDQGNAIQAELAVQALDNDPARLERAHAAGDALQATFWRGDRGYVLEAGIDQVYAGYGAWTSFGHLALYDADQNPHWLDLARQNLDAIGRSMGRPDGGVAWQTYRCTGRLVAFCPPGETGWVTDGTPDTAAGAWVQHLQVALAQRLGSTSQ